MNWMSGVARSGWLAVTVVAVSLLAGCGTGPGPEGPQGGPVDSTGQIVQLSSGDSSAYFELENTANETLDWHLEIDDSEDNPQSGRWFTIEPVEGRLEPYGRQLVTLVQKGGLAPGSYHSMIRVLYEGGVTVFEVIGEVSGDGSWETGDGSISGRLLTDNALIPLDPPSNLSTSSLTPAGQSREDPEPAFVPGELIVAFESGYRRQAVEEGGGAAFESLALDFARRHGLELQEQSDPDGTAIVRLPPGSDPRTVANALEDDPAVKYAEPNFRFYLHALPNDPLLADSWQLPVIGAPVAWEALDELGTGPVVAVLDSGIDIDHEDLRGAFVSGGYDFCASSNCSSRDSDVRPDTSADVHGTHVTGLVAALGGNGRGLAGALPSGARILPVKVFHYPTSSGEPVSSTASALTDAIEWAAGVGDMHNPHPADIITLSLGAGVDASTVRTAIERARDQGVLVIASAGNQGERDVDYPARYPSVVGVGAVNSNFERSCFSDYGEGLDIMAPGGDGYRCSAPRDEAILSTYPGSDYGLAAGTSMAAPLVAGAAAMVWGTMVEPSAERVRTRLLETAYSASYMDDDRYGAGVVRMDTALGFPGPGSEATVQATGPSTALDVVTLNAEGSSSEFLLEGLAPGTYRVAAEASGRSRALSGETDVTLGAGEDATETVQLGR